MRLPPACSYAAFVFLSWCAAGSLQASPPTSVTVNAPRSGTKLKSADGSVTIYRPLSDAFSKGREHPMPSPGSATAPNNSNDGVGLAVETAKSGDVSKVVVTHSSGSPLLDEIARTWVLYVWRYPATGAAETHREEVHFKMTRGNAAGETKEGFRDLSYPDTPRPFYPGIAIYKEWQGTVQMRMISDGAGKIKEAEVVRSSNVRLLDLEAKSWCERYWKLPKNSVTDCSIVRHAGAFQPEKS